MSPYLASDGKQLAGMQSRAANRSVILAAILAESGNVTRTRLAAHTGLSQATVSRVVDALIREGLVAEGDVVASGGTGRSAVTLHAAADRGLTCGVDLGGTNCRLVVGDLLGRPLARSQEVIPADQSAAGLAGWLGRLVTELAASCSSAELRAVAVGLPGVVSPDGVTVSGAPNLPQIEGDGFSRHLRRELGMPVSLHNDSNLALLGEMRFGAARGLGTVVMLTIGTGLGAGVALNGQLLLGRGGLVGEFGYLPAGPKGESLESLVAGAGLVQQARSLGAGVASAQDLFTVPPPAKTARVRRRFRHALLLLLTTAVIAYDPEAIVIGGGIAAAIAPDLAGIQRQLREQLPSAPDVVLSDLGGLSGAFGALAAACQAVYVDLGVDVTAATALPVISTFAGAGGIPPAPAPGSR
jgi:predicted NBD/HSP70 family sugar kinase